MSMQKRVTVLRDFSYEERAGEEELAIKRFLDAAPGWADVSVQPPEFAEPDDIANAGIVISFGLKRYPDQVFERLLEHPRHVHVFQDWWEPAQPKSEWRNRIAEAASIAIFFSKLHAERYIRLYQLEKVFGLKTPVYLVPFPMLESDYASAMLEVAHEDATLWCAPWHPDYGNDIMLRWAGSDKSVHAFGLAVPIGRLAPNVEGKGALALDAAAAVFRQYDRFAYFARTPVPFGFPVLLAYALGLEVIHSGEIGCLEDDVDALVDRCANAPGDFWQLIEAAA